MKTLPHRIFAPAAATALIVTAAAVPAFGVEQEPPATPAVDAQQVADLPWMDTSLAPQERARLLVEAMPEDRKLVQLAMRPFEEPNLEGCEFYSIARQVRGIPELALPTLRAVNGPTGVGGGACASEPQLTTAMPTSVGLGASFDPELSRQWGELIGHETKAIGHNVMLTPGINLVPNAHGGRTYEYFGEDPYLTGRMGITQVQGIESQGVQATPKHYVANEQETERWTMAVNIEQRALNTLQMLPFEMVVREADPSSIMCAYPEVNGTWACESDYLLDKRLRQDWDFSGYVMSDRGAVHSTAPSLNAGLALEFGNPLWFNTTNLNAALDAGDITWETIDTRLVERYTPMFRLGQFEHNWDQLLPIDYEAHNATATAIAEQGVVLMKNENDLLPLDADKLATMGDMLMIGPDSVVKESKIGNNGPNSQITPRTQERPILALREALADQGYTAFLHENNGSDLAAARELAAGMDAVIVVVTEFSSEFYDRDTLSLEPTENNDGSVTDQLALVEAMAEVNDNVIVLLKTANSVLTNSFEDDVEAMVQAWYPGQQDGLAVARVLTGEVNPGGKMPITWATQEREAQWAEERNWPGVWEDGQLTSYYTTGLEQGYRWYQANGVESSFPFGFGLSYTDFEMSAAQVTAASGVATVDVTVTNTGDRAGAEVPQVYLSFPDSFGEPPLRLVGFDKPFLQPGESATVSIPIDPQASNHPVGIFDVDGDQWVNPDGTIGIHLGTSSANTQQIGTLTMSGGALTGVTSTGLGDGEDPEPTPDPDPQGHMVFYNDEWSNQATNSVHMPNTVEGDDFFSGDWDGDGTDTIAVRRGNQIMLWNNDGTGAPDTTFYYGTNEDEVLVGDWNGDGVDTFTVRRGNAYHIRNTHSSGNAEEIIHYGRAADDVFVGDFNGDGSDTLAVRRENQIFVINTLRDGPADSVFWYGRPGETMFTGDWDGDGRDTFVVQRGNEWHVRNSLTTGNAEFLVHYGRDTDTPVIGDWNGDGRDTVAMIRPDER